MYLDERMWIPNSFNIVPIMLIVYWSLCYIKIIFYFKINCKKKYFGFKKSHIGKQYKKIYLIFLEKLLVMPSNHNSKYFLCLIELFSKEGWKSYKKYLQQFSLFLHPYLGSNLIYNFVLQYILFSKILMFLF